MRRRKDKDAPEPGRDFWFQWTFRAADDEEREKDKSNLADFSSGSRVSDFAHCTDEDIDNMLEWQRESLRRHLIMVRDREAELLRQKETPFWERWRGGV